MASIYTKVLTNLLEQEGFGAIFINPGFYGTVIFNILSFPFLIYSYQRARAVITVPIFGVLPIIVTVVAAILVFAEVVIWLQFVAIGLVVVSTVMLSRFGAKDVSQMEGKEHNSIS